MLDLPKNELDEIIQAEKKQVALEYHNEAWADGISEGIESEILAETALATAMTELVRLYGEDHAIDMIDGLRRRVEFGEFRANQTIQ
ncbi:hypothetical protein U0C82_15130 [Fulvimarina sp. 2208YS6-2-32]|uniref:Uncharacterized protein n=1 Tax=Fulvimarina uroteuthidis TaxID=3098149 RepID=A0ABU5I528_9HYPH|nr:hypothetical protein [Fulvimarina sp. 2208YS6-2-32]MDY8110474.1 hypothetical protein [Fulvimarina sp. 2208YS6-2-32]